MGEPTTDGRLDLSADVSRRSPSSGDALTPTLIHQDGAECLQSLHQRALRTEAHHSAARDFRREDDTALAKRLHMVHDMLAALNGPDATATEAPRCWALADSGNFDSPTARSTEEQASRAPSPASAVEYAAPSPVDGAATFGAAADVQAALVAIEREARRCVRTAEAQKEELTRERRALHEAVQSEAEAFASALALREQLEEARLAAAREARAAADADAAAKDHCLRETRCAEALHAAMEELRGLRGEAERHRALQSQTREGAAALRRQTERSERLARQKEELERRLHSLRVPAAAHGQVRQAIGGPREGAGASAGTAAGVGTPSTPLALLSTVAEEPSPSAVQPSSPAVSAEVLPPASIPTAAAPTPRTAVGTARHGRPATALVDSRAAAASPHQFRRSTVPPAGAAAEAAAQVGRLQRALAAARKEAAEARAAAENEASARCAERHAAATELAVQHRELQAAAVASAAEAVSRALSTGATEAAAHERAWLDERARYVAAAEAHSRLTEEAAALSARLMAAMKQSEALEREHACAEAVWEVELGLARRGEEEAMARAKETLSLAAVLERRAREGAEGREVLAQARFDQSRQRAGLTSLLPWVMSDVNEAVAAGGVAVVDGEAVAGEAVAGEAVAGGMGADDFLAQQATVIAEPTAERAPGKATDGDGWRVERGASWGDPTWLCPAVAPTTTTATTTPSSYSSSSGGSARWVALSGRLLRRASRYDRDEYPGSGGAATDGASDEDDEKRAAQAVGAALARAAAEAESRALSMALQEAREALTRRAAAEEVARAVCASELGALEAELVTAAARAVDESTRRVDAQQQVHAEHARAATRLSELQSSLAAAEETREAVEAALAASRSECEQLQASAAASEAALVAAEAPLATAESSLAASQRECEEQRAAAAGCRSQLADVEAALVEQQSLLAAERREADERVRQAETRVTEHMAAKAAAERDSAVDAVRSEAAAEREAAVSAALDRAACNQQATVSEHEAALDEARREAEAALQAARQEAEEAEAALQAARQEAEEAEAEATALSVTVAARDSRLASIEIELATTLTALEVAQAELAEVRAQLSENQSAADDAHAHAAMTGAQQAAIDGADARATRDEHAALEATVEALRAALADVDVDLKGAAAERRARAAAADAARASASAERDAAQTRAAEATREAEAALAQARCDAAARHAAEEALLTSKREGECALESLRAQLGADEARAQRGAAARLADTTQAHEAALDEARREVEAALQAARQEAEEAEAALQAARQEAEEAEAEATALSVTVAARDSRLASIEIELATTLTALEAAQAELAEVRAQLSENQGELVRVRAVLREEQSCSALRAQAVVDTPASGAEAADCANVMAMMAALRASLADADDAIGVASSVTMAAHERERRLEESQTVYEQALGALSEAAHAQRAQGLTRAQQQRARTFDALHTLATAVPIAVHDGADGTGDDDTCTVASDMAVPMRRSVSMAVSDEGFATSKSPPPLSPPECPLLSHRASTESLGRQSVESCATPNWLRSASVACFTPAVPHLSLDADADADADGARDERRLVSRAELKGLLDEARAEGRAAAIAEGGTAPKESHAGNSTTRRDDAGQLGDSLLARGDELGAGAADAMTLEAAGPSVAMLHSSILTLKEAAEREQRESPFSAAARHVGRLTAAALGTVGNSTDSPIRSVSPSEAAPSASSNLALEGQAVSELRLQLQTRDLRLAAAESSLVASQRECEEQRAAAAGCRLQLADVEAALVEQQSLLAAERREADERVRQARAQGMESMAAKAASPSSAAGSAPSTPSAGAGGAEAGSAEPGSMHGVQNPTDDSGDAMRRATDEPGSIGDGQGGGVRPQRASTAAKRAAAERDAALASQVKLTHELSAAELRAAEAEAQATGLQAQVSELTSQLQNVILARKREAEQSAAGGSSTPSLLSPLPFLRPRSSANGAPSASRGALTTPRARKHP